MDKGKNFQDMAKKVKKTKKPSQNQHGANSNVVRIRATSQPSRKQTSTTSLDEITPVKAEKAKAVKTVKLNATTSPKKTKVLKPVRAAGGYFKGAWVELRQVRWPNRRATWSLTFAVLAYSALFVAMVLLLDAGFKYLFELILGK